MLLHGPSGHQLKKSHHADIPNDPFYLWSGGCKEKWAVSFENKNGYWNLNSAKMKLRTWQSGDSKLHILLNFFNTGWVISKFAIKHSETWQITNLVLPEQIWYGFDILNIDYVPEKLSTDLEDVKAIGFSDLTTGEGSSKCSRLDWFEIWSV